jgi:hypothetical protein
MLNIEALDKVIAMVVVLVALSLFVQSLQALGKKLFKIKSLQIEQSLVHLYHYVLNKNVLDARHKGKRFGALRNKIDQIVDGSPFMRMVLPRTRHPSERDPQVEALYKGVAGEFRKVGRVTQSGKLMLDSISRDDLLKFMGTMPVAGIISKMLSGEGEVSLVDLRTKIAAYLGIIDRIQKDYEQVVVDTRFVQLQETFIPLLRDVCSFLSGADDGSGAILADMAKLKEVNPKEVLQLLDQLPNTINDILEQVQSKNVDPPTLKEATVTALNELKGSLTDVSASIRKVIQAFATVQALKSRVENWYETVMQGFNERYTRSMKTWTVIISACVVILLNANIINIYRDISTSDTKRALILQSAEKFRERAATQKKEELQNSDPTGQQAGNQQNDTALTPEQFYKEATEIVNKNVNDLTSIGLKGPRWIRAVPAFWNGEGYFGEQMKSDPYFRTKLVGRTLMGWLIMTLLLSAGAPFWEDILESLFGLKNRIRKQTGTQNVETPSGAGNPKP